MTTVQLFFRKHFINQLPLILLSFVLVWIIHTYLMAVVNEGFYASGAPVSNWIFTPENGVSAFVIWTFLPFFLWYVVLSSFKFGVKSTMNRMITIPLLILRKVRTAQKIEVDALLTGITLGLIVTMIITLNVQAWLILVAVIVVLCLSNAGIAIASRLFRSWEYFKPVLLPMKVGLSDNVKVKEAYLFFLGLAPGILLTTFFTSNQKLVVIVMMIVILVIRNTTIGKNSIAKSLLLPLLITSGLILITAIPLLADDGGLAECSGNWEKWLTDCEGSRETLRRGGTTATGAAVTPTVADAATDTDGEATPITSFENLFGFNQ
jgi:hypothetical protein